MWRSFWAGTFPSDQIIIWGCNITSSNNFRERPKCRDLHRHVFPWSSSREGKWEQMISHTDLTPVMNDGLSLQPNWCILVCSQLLLLLFWWWWWWCGVLEVSPAALHLILSVLVKLAVDLTCYLATQISIIPFGHCWKEWSYSYLSYLHSEK